MQEEAQTPLVLLADDDAEVRTLVRRSIEDLGCEIIEAVDGDEALTAIISERPDLVVLDVMMPVLSGWEICKYVRSHDEYADMRILMLTAVGPTTNSMTAPLFGADDHLDKPFDIIEIKTRVARLLSKQR